MRPVLVAVVVFLVLEVIGLTSSALPSSPGFELAQIYSAGLTLPNLPGFPDEH